MPPSSRYSRASSRSPTRSNSFTSTSTGEKRSQVVKRLAITGKAQRKADGDLDGAALRMYLRMTIPANSVAPGGSIPLFPEENIKILDTVIQPLDSSFAPYNFTGEKTQVLLKAMRILNLPPRLPESYLSLFGGSPTASPPPTNLNAGKYERKYYGEILVNDYQISYILPKEFPPRVYETENFTKRSANEMHFMAVVDLWVPYVSMPPHSPYLLSIPVPRCLSNQIRLRIFPPKSSKMSSSLASLSSQEGDTTSWDLTADPPVTRTTKRPGRNNSFNNFADDESSDSSVTTADGYGVQGSFPSTDRIRIRWATPRKAEDVPETSDAPQSRHQGRQKRLDVFCAPEG
ncbi:hypothetical protein NM688_g3572 [Phlebia brevispora]|uniref:Uncharacterized protein n=1 Tax=Phlebia brevispora TaxID=194682 RepID=A0ACC1T5K0_9APHY|nr:hypothetical protein NM688_g3572 [Phlebia brevispora]